MYQGNIGSLSQPETAGLGTVNADTMAGVSSGEEFFSLVVCDIKIPRYSEFEDQNMLRACDASCTEQVEQSRMCLNGGVAGGPGCIGEAMQTIVRRCNTGPKPDGLCPLVMTPMTVIPLLILDEDE